MADTAGTPYVPQHPFDVLERRRRRDGIGFRLGGGEYGSQHRWAGEPAAVTHGRNLFFEAVWEVAPFVPRAFRLQLLPTTTKAYQLLRAAYGDEPDRESAAERYEVEKAIENALWKAAQPLCSVLGLSDEWSEKRVVATLRRWGWHAARGADVERAPYLQRWARIYSDWKRWEDVPRSWWEALRIVYATETVTPEAVAEAAATLALERRAGVIPPPPVGAPPPLPDDPRTFRLDAWTEPFYYVRWPYLEWTWAEYRSEVERQFRGHLQQRKAGGEPTHGAKTLLRKQLAEDRRAVEAFARWAGDVPAPKKLAAKETGPELPVARHFLWLARRQCCAERPEQIAAADGAKRTAVVVATEALAAQIGLRELRRWRPGPRQSVR